MKKAFLFAIIAAIVFPMISMADEGAATPEKTEKAQKERKAPQGPRAPMTLFKFDANNDGVVTKDELPKDNKFVEGMFNHTDADKDGKVTKEEEDAHKAELNKRYVSLCADGWIKTGNMKKLSPIVCFSQTPPPFGIRRTGEASLLQNILQEGRAC
ncbi:MAG: EF-hand domain-containing protein, partial [Thermoguttaceae bacterium]|nr:EF-hand domain-containing protein [Thermoguttaceae bacterium]